MVDRDYIIAEIRRTAADNGGVPPGSKRFSDASGIKEADWLGRYWARWNDALKEAGFPPNKLQAAFDIDLLIERLASLIAELGHFPVKAEFQLKARRDRTFPNYKTFRRLGSKRQAADSIINYCHGRSGSQEVLRVCTAIVQDLSFPKEPTSVRSKSIFGEVYLLKFGRSYKIGRTNSVGRRERELAIQLPEKATLIHIIKTDDPQGIESYWHRPFEDRRKNGEWFELSPDDVSAFKRRRFM